MAVCGAPGLSTRAMRRVGGSGAGGRAALVAVVGVCEVELQEPK